MKEKLLPSAVLTIVCSVVCGLLAAVNATTQDKIVQAEADKVQRSLVQSFGEGTYTPLDVQYDGVTAVYESQDGLRIFDITADGYSKGGIRALIGISPEGAVSGIGIVSCTETAGVGTKITDNAYLTEFSGTASPEDLPDAISGATFSSKGLQSAVTLALHCAEGSDAE